MAVRRVAFVAIAAVALVLTVIWWPSRGRSAVEPRRQTFRIRIVAAHKRRSGPRDLKLTSFEELLTAARGELDGWPVSGVPGERELEGLYADVGGSRTEPAVRVQVDLLSFPLLSEGSVVWVEAVGWREAMKAGLLDPIVQWKGWPPQHDDRGVVRVEPSEREERAGCPKERRRFHTVVTTSSAIYEQWIMRAAYFWFKRQRERDVCGEMGGFTRL
eukprot:Hpha_TRINITY_DN20104_c0_g1::TRINITY_DN20104_c0_g1_i1::g.82516::m.82516